MSEMEEHKPKSGAAIFVVILIFLLLAGLIFALEVFDKYSVQFHGIFPGSGNRADWGVLGDFVGGVFNPLLSFISFTLLLFTLFQNQKQLELSSRELKESSAALKKQAETLDIQRFDDTFFAMLSEHNRILERLLSSKKEFMDKSCNHREGDEIDRLISIVSSISIRSLTGTRDTLLGNKTTPIHQYFRYLYQLLKLIAVRASKSPDTNKTPNFREIINNSDSSTENEKFYSSIVRSAITEDLTYLLAVNCATSDATNQFFSYRQLVERYALLEHLPFDSNRYLESVLFDIARLYHPSAFGNNSGYLDYFEGQANGVRTNTNK